MVRPAQAGESPARLPAPAEGDADLAVASHALPRYPGLRFGWPAGRMLRRLWTENRPHAVYIATEGPLGFSAMRAANALGIVVLTGFHTRFDDYLDHYRAGFLKPLAEQWLRVFHNRGQATLVPTLALQDELRARGIHAVRILQRGVDIDRFHPDRRDAALRSSWGVEPSNLVMMYVGRLAPEKNLDLLIASFHALRAERADTRLVIVGDGPAAAALRRECPDAFFAGVQLGDDLARHYASADLFVFPSLSETYGNVTLEALASGVPAIAFAQGAALEHLGGDAGVAVDPDDPAAFIADCVALGTDDVRRANARKAARRAVAHLHPEQVAQGFEDLLRQWAPEGRIVNRDSAERAADALARMP